jgi:hypothetical protein
MTDQAPARFAARRAAIKAMSVEERLRADARDRLGLEDERQPPPRRLRSHPGHQR